ncbi:MAG: hypothetical protein JRC92_09125, partial [Deltaproteobacteria bacterium]|nr:hypothetical protein [Deltaproteobacteria bacterium]
MKITLWPQLAIFILAVLASMGLGRGLWTVDWPYGDEIHYLIGMHSLAREGDLDLEDNYARDDGRIFGYPVSDAHARRTAGARYLSTHTPGVYLLGAGPYALAGAAGVYLFYHLLFGLLAVLLYRIAL